MSDDGGSRWGEHYLPDMVDLIQFVTQMQDILLDISRGPLFGNKKYASDQTTCFLFYEFLQLQASTYIDRKREV